MPDFNYQMSAADGSLVDGTMSAADEVELATRVRTLGGVLLSAKPARSGPKRRAKISRRELITFTQHLLTAQKAGITVLSAIDGYASQAEDPNVGYMLHELSRSVEGGLALSDAMGAYPKTFPDMYRNMIAAGEASGHLDSIMERLVSYLEWRDQMAQEMRQATIYPAVVISMVGALIVFLLTFVLPRFTGIFEGAAMELPLATRILMGLGTLFGSNWPWLIGGVVVLVGGYKMARKSKRGDLWLERQQLNIPLFGKNIRFIHMSQMTYSLGLLIGAGVNITQALELSLRSVTNRHLAVGMRQVAERVNAGMSLTDALSHTGHLPGLALQMIAVGEQSGTLAESLSRCTEYLRKEVQHGLKTAMKILEPTITLFLGVVVGGIALTIFYTLYKMIMAVGGTH